MKTTLTFFQDSGRVPYLYIFSEDLREKWSYLSCCNLKSVLNADETVGDLILFEMPNLGSVETAMIAMEKRNYLFRG